MKKEINQPISLTRGIYKPRLSTERILTRIIEVLQPYMNYKFKKGKDLPCVHKNNDDPQFRTRVFSLPIKKLLAPGSQNYSYLKDSLQALMNQHVKLKGSDENGDYELFTGLIKQFVYYSDESIVKVEMNDQVLSFLIDTVCYSRFSLDVALNCSSAYTMRIYKMISHWRGRGEGYEREFRIGYLRSTLCLGDKYTKPSGILSRILLPAQKELEKKGDVYFEIVRAIKEGRRVDGWVVKIVERSKKKTTVLGLEKTKPISPRPKKLEAAKVETHPKSKTDLKDHIASLKRDYWTDLKVEQGGYQVQVDPVTQRARERYLREQEKHRNR